MALRFMNYTNDTHIASVEDVKSFFHHLAFDLNMSFHPDDDFSDYTNFKTGENSLSTDDVKLYNRLMNECHSVCEIFGADIYQLGLNVMRERMGIVMK